MSKRSPLRSFIVRSASSTVAALLMGVVACSSTDPSTGGSAGASPGGSASTGTAGAGQSVAGSGMTSAGAPSAGAANIAGSTSAGGTGAAGSSNGSAGSGTAGLGGGATASGGSGGGSGGSTNGGSGGSTTTDCSSLKLCDDFEGDAPGKGASPWKVNGGTAVSVVTDQHNSGMHSVHIVAPNTANFSANIQETKTFPAADFWGRAYFRFKAAAGGDQMYIAVNLSGNQLRLMNRLGSDNAQVNFQTGDKFYDTGFKIPQEKWFCYEWHVTTSAVNISVDGVARAVTVPGITGGTSLSLGFQRYAAGGGDGEIWIDDVAVSDKQIGCN